MYPAQLYQRQRDQRQRRDLGNLHRCRRHFPRIFPKQEGVFTTLDPPGAVRTQAEFLNAHGEVVGVYRDANQTRHGFIWSKGVFTTFDVPGSAAPLGTVGFGINDHGEVVGDYVDSDGNRHGFVRSKGVYTTLDVPGAVLTVAEGINNPGEIVGLYIDADGNQHGFVLCRGVYTTIDVPGSAQPGSFRSTRKAKSWDLTMMLTASPTASLGRLPTEP